MWLIQKPQSILSNLEDPFFSKSLKVFRNISITSLIRRLR